MIAHILKRKKASQKRRQARIRSRVSGTAERPRLVVTKSNRYTRAALVDDTSGTTIIGGTTMGVKPAKGEDFAKVALAKGLGTVIAKAALEKGLSSVVFDRGGNRYTGRVKAVAEGAREAGLKF